MKTQTKLEIALTAIIGLLLVGTFAYHNIEKWNYVDSLYFTGTTLLTIGFGDLHPTTPFSKVFTIVFAYIGIGINLYAISLIATLYFEHRARIMEDVIQKRLLESLRRGIDVKALRKKHHRFWGKKRRNILEGSR